MNPLRQTHSRPDADDRFEAVYRKHYGRVLAYALRRTTPEVAHDVVADTFLVAWRRLDRLPGDPLPRLLGVARKTLANHRRAARRRDALLTQLKTVDAMRPSNDPDAPSFSLGEIAVALDRLPGSDRELLELIAWDDLTVGEAAAVLGVSRATCRVRLYRARRRLAAELGRGDEAGARRPAAPFPDLAKEQE